MYVQTTDDKSDATITITDALGQVISQKGLGIVTNGTAVTIESADLPNGMYHVSLRTAGNVVSKKLVVGK
jgi:Secretion system C-terminal sorting domain